VYCQFEYTCCNLLSSQFSSKWGDVLEDDSEDTEEYTSAIYCAPHNIFVLSKIMERTAKIEAKMTDFRKNAKKEEAR